MEPGNIVEFIDNQKIYCAIVLESKTLRLRLLTENNREVKLSANRLSHRSQIRLDPGWTRDKLVSALKEISAHRRALSEQINIQELWEVLNSEQEWVDLLTMTEFCFPQNPNGDHEAAVLRAFFHDRLFFKFSVDQFLPHTAEKVGHILSQRESEERQERLIDQGAAWLQRVSKGQAGDPPADAGTISEILISYYLYENESPERALARAILKKAGVTTPARIFSFLVKEGIWDPNENIDLLRFKIRVDHPADVEARALELSSKALPDGDGRRDLRDIAAITIDGPSTLDFDDALSLSFEDDHYVLGIHIADAGYFVPKEDIVDQEALSRASSIYTLDQKITMLPATLSEGVCSLKAGEVRPALSTLIKVTPQARIIDFEIVPSLIRVSRQLTYGDVDAMLGDDAQLNAMYQLAKAYRSLRLDHGALPIEIPEIIIGLNDKGEPTITKVEREAPSRFLVAELMIMANELAARFLKNAGLPAVFRAQPETRERLFQRDQGSLYQNWMQRKQISRFLLTSEPEPHTGLGVAAYLTCTSPIRKYTDLINQRQLRAALGLDEPYKKEAIDFIIAALREPMAQVGRIQFRRHRYWVLKYLESCIGRKEEAMVLSRRREGHAIVLLNYMIETILVGANNIALKPEDSIQVTVQHVNARNDVLTVYFG